jgi:hypothetical protein
MRLFIAGLLLATSASLVSAAPYHCDKDAMARAGKLLKLHFESEGSQLAAKPGEPDANAGDKQAWSLDTAPKKIGAIKALKGKGKFDVLEINGFIYKASYRMRFIYAQIPDSCVLMGQEVLENSDPY